MLSRSAIKHLIQVGLIEISPFVEGHVGPNSVDLRLGDRLQTYHLRTNRIPVVDPGLNVEYPSTYWAIDPKNPPPLLDVPKTPDGKWLLVPGRFYLGETLEKTTCKGVVPHLDGRSTCGRLSIEVHKTAGVGDNGFSGRWTLEIEVTEPVLVSPGDRLLQVYFEPCWGKGLAKAIEILSREEKEIPLAGAFLAFMDIDLLELKDLYGKEGHHYQDSETLKGAAPLS